MITIDIDLNSLFNLNTGNFKLQSLIAVENEIKPPYKVVLPVWVSFENFNPATASRLIFFAFIILNYIL